MKRALLALAVAACTETPTPIAPPPVARGETVTVMTYNVNFGLAGDAEGVAAIREIDADVVLLQETTEEWQRALDGLYPYAAFQHCCRAGGLAVLSKFPIEPKEYIPSPTRWFPAWRVIVDTPIGRVQTLNLHLHPMVSESGSWVSGFFTTGDERVEELEAFLPSLDPSLPTVIAGDLNELPDGAALRHLGERGFVDALGSRDAKRRTWRWGTSLGELSMQLDHVLHDAKLEIVAVDVIERGRSDHFPIVATVRRAAR